MTALGGTIPNGQEIEGRLAELDECLLETNRSVQGMDRGLKYVIEQVDPLEQDLGVQHTQPANLNYLHKELLLDYHKMANLMMMNRCAPGLLAWAKDRE
eukprot:12768725-Prorocentrum_lima.AAC.1